MRWRYGVPNRSAMCRYEGWLLDEMFKIRLFFFVRETNAPQEEFFFRRHSGVDVFSAFDIFLGSIYYTNITPT